MQIYKYNIVMSNFGGGVMFKKVLRNKNFALLGIGGFISSIGDYMYYIGITVYLYTETKSVGAIAFMWLSRAVLRIPMQYISGIIADKYNKKKAIAYTNLISAVFAFLFVFVDKSNIWLTYVLAFVLQSLNDIDLGSETAILPELVSKEELSYYNSAFSFLESISTFLSPALGGIIYKLKGSKILFIINAISFLIAGLLFCCISYKHTKVEKSKSEFSIFKSGLEGYHVLIKYIDVKTIFIIMSIYGLIGRFYETYKVAISDTLLNIKPEGIIYFDYAMAIGGLLVPFLIKRLSNYKDVYVFIISSLMISISYLVFGYSTSFVATFAILIILGIASTIQGVLSRTIIQKEIPQEFIGRVFSFYKILLTLFAIIALLIAEPLYKLIGSGNTFLIFVVISFILCLSQLRNGRSNDKAIYKQ